MKMYRRIELEKCVRARCLPITEQIQPTRHAKLIAKKVAAATATAAAACTEL